MTNLTRRIGLGIVIWSAALSAPAALVFDGLRHYHTIEVIRRGQVITPVTVPAGAAVQVDADSVSNDKAKEIATFRGKAIAKVKLADEVLFSISADEIRLVSAKRI